MRKIVCYLVFSLCFSSLIFGQEFIEGRVLDSNKQPISYASIYFDSSNKRSVTNEEGGFRVKLQGKRLHVSCIGYESKSIRIDSLNTLQVDIALEPATILLNEVTIEPVDAKGMVQKSIDRLSINYPNEFIKLNGVFKQLNKTNNKNNTYLNADVDLYIKILSDFKKRKTATTINSYKIVKNKSERTVYSEPSGPLNHIYLKSYPFISQVDKYKFDFLYDIEYNDDILTKISFEPEKRNTRAYQYKGTIFIDKDNYAILYIEYELLPVSKTNKNILFGVSQKTELWKCKIMFEESDDSYIPNYYNSESTAVLKINNIKIKNEVIRTNNITNFIIKDCSIYKGKTLPVNQSIKDMMSKTMGADFNADHNYDDDFILETTQEKEIKKLYGQ